MRLGVAAVLVLLVVGCGSLEGPRTGTVSPPTDALARWKDFPASQVPRPIVLLTNTYGPSSYVSGDAKVAGMCGKFTVTVKLSWVVPNGAEVGWADGTSRIYPAMSAFDAYTALINNASGHASPACASATPLVVSDARYGLSRFHTDRGTPDMSSWTFTVAGTEGGIAYPALVPSAFWGGGLSAASIGGGATVDATGRQLTFSFIGGPPDGQCAVNYVGVVAESPHAVAVAVQSNPGRPKAGPIACDTVGHVRSVTVQLASPLGGRVLVDASGAAVETCPEAIRAGC